ncbi:L,D-transpeptidase [Afifella pfennigii]|uniref:L,D-transpeptidase n=1 Tax=Afifella pfennigii TaxID=209897 RepID=UPI00047A4EB7|nr:L,D-transpeptidase [Afifella pfennigii]
MQRTLRISLAVLAGFLIFTCTDAARALTFFDPVSGTFVSVDQRYSTSRRVPQKYGRQTVRYTGGEKPGTVIIDTRAKFLYYVLPGRRAVRYGVGVGREGFGWSGEVHVGRKSEWPRWIPPKEMIAREPRLKQYAGGMPGGPSNPLGARALYLFDGGRDTLYRIHGTNEPWTIGLNVSSGCIRLVNDDIIDLYGRVGIGTKVIVL